MQYNVMLQAIDHALGHAKTTWATSCHLCMKFHTRRTIIIRWVVMFHGVMYKILKYLCATEAMTDSAITSMDKPVHGGSDHLSAACSP